MVRVRKVVLDVAKPQEPGIIDFSRALGNIKGIDSINIALIEIDRKVENVRITIVGSDIDVEKAFGTIESLGGAIHSVDEVVVGKEVINYAKTLEEA